MDIRSIGELLAKYRTRFTDADERKKIIQETLSGVVRTDITDRDIVITKDSIVLKISSANKNEIFMRKKEILADLKAKGVSGIHDIR